MAAHNLPIFEISIIISKKDGVPIIELRRRSSKADMIRTLIYAALKGQPIKVLPVFKSRLQSINSMVDKGIIYYDTEKETFDFNI